MNQDFKEFFASLNAKQVEFLIVGGAAFNFHATPRATKDIDVWVGPTRANLSAFLDALTAFGFEHQLDADQLANENRVLILGRAPNRIDVLTQPSGIDWATCWGNRIESNYAGEPVAFLSVVDLIQSKRAAGRPQDLVDAAKLEKIVQKSAKQS